MAFYQSFESRPARPSRPRSRLFRCREELADHAADPSPPTIPPRVDLISHFCYTLVVPQTAVHFYLEVAGEVPVRDWLLALRKKDQKAAAKCIARIELLAEMGHELRRPIADFLRDGIYELRARKGNVNYRVLYFFHGKDVAILAHGLTKEAEVPDVEIERALRRKAKFEANPEAHRFEYDPSLGLKRSGPRLKR